MKITIEPTKRFTTVDGALCWLWRGVDQDGAECDVFVRRVDRDAPLNIEHRTSNIERPTLKSESSMLDVRCWTFDVPSLNPQPSTQP